MPKKVWIQTKDLNLFGECATKSVQLSLQEEETSLVLEKTVKYTYLAAYRIDRGCQLK